MKSSMQRGFTRRQAIRPVAIIMQAITQSLCTLERIVLDPTQLFPFYQQGLPRQSQTCLRDVMRTVFLSASHHAASSQKFPITWSSLSPCGCCSKYILLSMLASSPGNFGTLQVVTSSAVALTVSGIAGGSWGTSPWAPWKMNSQAHNRDGLCSGCCVPWIFHHRASPRRCTSRPASPLSDASEVV